MSSILKVDTINEVTSANGVTVDGLSIKDSKLVTADSVVTTNITNSNITNAKLASGSFSNITGTGTLTSFRSTGIDDNADALAMTIDSSERVGIGNASPAAKLQVTTASSGIAPHVSADEIAIENSANSGISILSGNSNEGAIYFGIEANNDAANYIKVVPNQPLIFRTNNTDRVQIHSGGVMSAANGIALGVGTANTASNVLDDYEEGTWTAGVNQGTVNNIASSYIKVGDKVTVWSNIDTFSNRTSTETVRIGGLPFAISGDTQGKALGSIMIRYSDKLVTTAYSSTSTQIAFYASIGTGFVPLKYNDLNNSSANMTFIATYTAA